MWWALRTDQVTQLSALLTVPWTLKFLWAPLVDDRRGGLRAWTAPPRRPAADGADPAADRSIPVPDGYSLLLGFLLIHALCAATRGVGFALAAATIPAGARRHGWMQLGMLLGRACFGGIVLTLERCWPAPPWSTC